MSDFEHKSKYFLFRIQFCLLWAPNSDFYMFALLLTKKVFIIFRATQQMLAFLTILNIVSDNSISPPPIIIETNLITVKIRLNYIMIIKKRWTACLYPIGTTHGICGQFCPWGACGRERIPALLVTIAIFPLPQPTGAPILMLLFILKMSISHEHFQWKLCKTLCHLKPEWAPKCKIIVIWVKTHSALKMSKCLI